MTRTFRAALPIAIVLAAGASMPAAADVCVTIDESRDLLSAEDRAAALVVLTRQFELAGERVVADGCPAPYVVAHVRLGQAVLVTLSGPAGRRDLTASGLEELPAVYSQMVRSLLAGRSIDARGVVDRTNVTSEQATTAKRIRSDSVAYARLGYGATFGGGARGGPSVALFGYRKELDRLAIDVSFLNFQYQSKPSSYAYDAYGYAYESGNSSFTGTWLKLTALRYATPRSDGSFYAGGGLSWGSTSRYDGGTSWFGNGLQGELTAGYEIGRASTVRVFVQADATLPFYVLNGETHGYSYSYSSNPRAFQQPTVTIQHRYAPTLALSLALGWQRGGR